MTEHRIIIGMPRMAKYGTCAARYAPSRMVKDVTEHEGLHLRRQDCFSWAWDARTSAIAYEAGQLLEKKRRLAASVIDVEEIADEPVPLELGPARDAHDE